MKVLHINTLSTGGAAKAAIRLHQGLMQSGIDSHMLFLKSRPDVAVCQAETFLQDSPPTVIQKAVKKLGWHKNIRQKQQEKLAATKGRYEYVSFPQTNYRVEDHFLVQEADIIHLHWIANFINYPSFFRSIHQPIIWTFHDKNPFLGICHYNNDLRDNSAAFIALDSENEAIKYQALSAVDDLTVVTPSASLGDFSANSRIFNRFTHRVIANAVDLDVFKPYDRAVARQLFNLPDDKTVFLFVSENVENKWKGFDLLLEAIRPFETRENIVICAAGKLNQALANKNSLSVGTIRDERLMALLYSAADAFVLPTSEDNLPNTMLEAMACGTPVISFPVGGMKETIIPGMNGLLAEDISAASLRRQLTRFLSMPEGFDRKQIRSFAVEKFSLTGQAKAYTRLYEEIADDKKINGIIR